MRPSPHHHDLGLRRLWCAITNPVPRKQHKGAVIRRTQVCLAWEEGDTPASVLARHPELAEDEAALVRRMKDIRELLPGSFARKHLQPWQVARAYLAATFPHANSILH